MFKEFTRLSYTGLVVELEYCFWVLLLINKAKAKDKMYMSVSVMKDYKLKLRKLRTSHTLG
jgi:hypothetical protein